MNSRINIQDLPANLIAYLYQFLDTKEMVLASTSSKKMRKAFNQDFIYIELAKSEIFKEKKFDIFSMEAQITGANSGVIPDENIYYYGRVSNKEREFNFYILKAYKNKGIMRIQIAFNSDFLDFQLFFTKKSNE